MNVTLNIENDAELRAYIKDCIKGQVMSIVRDEFLEIVKEELERKLKGLSTQRNFDYIMKESMTVAISDLLRKDCDVYTWKTSFVEPVIEKIVTKAVENKDWNRLVDELAKQKVRALLEK